MTPEEKPQLKALLYDLRTGWSKTEDNAEEESYWNDPYISLGNMPVWPYLTGFARKEASTNAPECLLLLMFSEGTTRFYAADLPSLLALCAQYAPIIQAGAAVYQARLHEQN